MDYVLINGELYHSGIKNMKWGIRRYQNKDGSLTPEGKKRYGDKPGSSKSSVDTKKKADMQGETTEEKRARLLKSTDAKELYENRHLLTTNELNERINRIDTEVRLSSKIVQETKKTGMERVKAITENINTITNLYKSVDNAYSVATGSSIGKSLSKKLGIDVPKTKEFDLDDFWKNRNTKTAAELMEVNKRLTAEEQIKEKMARRQAQHSDINEQEVLNMTESQLFVESYLAHHNLKPDELAHYGVIGMKWGIRRGKTSEAYAKASKKLAKMDKKIEKLNKKARAQRAYADAKESRLFVSDDAIRKANKRASKANSKAINATRAGRKWYERMEKEFGKTDISLTKEQHDIGKKYLDTINTYTMLRNYR